MRVYLFSLLILAIAVKGFAQTGFEDQSFSSGIFHLGSNHGVSFGDINNDGLEDVYVAVREEGVSNKLYLNKGGLVFEEIAATAGVNDLGSSAAAVWGDINNDGYLDLYVGNGDTPNRLYINNGDKTFTDITESAGVGDPFDPRSVQFADIDNDGLLDIYVHNFNTENVLYRNNGDNTFTDVTQASGALNTGPAMGTLFIDLDNDGDLDLYLLNDGSTNALYENLGDGTFKDISVESGMDLHCSCMGVDFADMDHDGDYDFYVTNYGVNYLFENNGDLTFTDRGDELKVDDYGMGWGTFWFDFDNDGDQDIYLANHQFISPRPNMLYRNDGGAFPHISADSEIESLYASFGTAVADLNNDGYPDMVVANWGSNARNRLYVNRNEGSNSVLIKAIGVKSNTSAIGAKVTLKSGSMMQIDQVTGATGYASQNSLVLHFGLGQNTMIDELTIDWPSGISETYTNISVNKYLTLTEEEGMKQANLGEELVTSITGEKESSAKPYPNPFTDKVFIPISGQLEGLSLEVYTLNGAQKDNEDQLVQVGEQWGFYWDGRESSGARLSKGIYLYRVNSAEKGLIKTGKLIIDK